MARKSSSELTDKEAQYLTSIPAFPFVKSDGGLSEAKRRYDYNNCTVRALAVATGLAYDEAHEELARWGRAVGAGADFRNWAKQRAPYLTWTPLNAVRGEPRVTVLEFCHTYNEGRFVLSVANHVLAVVDGVAHDVTPYAAEKCVYGFWQVDLDVLSSPNRGIEPVAARKPFSRKEAEDITDRIRFAVDTLWELLLEAHDRQAWRALGYRSWTAYIAGEFDFGRQYAYRLLDQARVIHELRSGVEEVSPMGDNSEVTVTEREAREIKPVIGEVVEAVKVAVAEGAEPQEAVTEAVEKARTITCLRCRQGFASTSELEQHVVDDHGDTRPEVEPEEEENVDDWRERSKESVGRLRGHLAALGRRYQTPAIGRAWIRKVLTEAVILAEIYMSEDEVDEALRQLLKRVKEDG